MKFQSNQAHYLKEISKLFEQLKHRPNTDLEMVGQME